MINKDELKNSLTLSEISFIIDNFGGQPKETNFGLTSLTICHNKPDNTTSRKLYYYENTHLFKCYTECNDTFDIFELVIKCFAIQKNEKLTLTSAIYYILNKLGKSSFNFLSTNIGAEDDVIEKLIDQMIEQEQKVYEKKELKKYSDNLIKNLPCLRIKDWEDENISYNTLKKFNIRYYPITAQIVIPHYNINNELIGIRGRQMIKEEAEMYGKYMPLIASGKIYNHPLGFNLYGLNINKENILKTKTVILFEGEKSVLKAEEYLDMNISVAVCGSVLSDYQVDLLLSLEINELIIAFDKQYKKYKDEECLKWHSKINKIVCKYKDYVKISVIFDTDELLGYKDSPIDCGKEVFLELYRNRQEAN